MAKRALTIALALSATAAPAPGARASTCFAEPGPFVLPLPSVPAPINARPVVRLQQLDADEACYDPVCAEEVERVVLVEAPRPRRVAIEVPTAVTTATSGRTKTFYLAPTEVLSRETRYELRAIVKGNSGNVGRKLLGTFRTGGQSDVTPPVAGVFDSAIVHPVPPRPRGTIILMDFPQEETFVRLFGTRATDDQASDPALMYAVWSSPAGTPIDYGAPPKGLFRPEPLFAPTDPRQLFDLGAESTCSVSSFDFPNEGKLTIGIRPVDLAGNFGAAAELPIDLQKSVAELKKPSQKRK